jgi:hypothetical protein
MMSSDLTVAEAVNRVLISFSLTWVCIQYPTVILLSRLTTLVKLLP